MSERRLTIAQVMENTPKVFVPEAAVGVEATVQFDITGREASKWALAIKDGKCTVEQAEIASPTMVMTIDTDDYLDIIEGKSDAMKAFMGGKIRVKGNMMMAMNFAKYFRLGKVGGG